MSTFSGHLIDRYPYLSLDRFDANNLKSTIYWLSHAHSGLLLSIRSDSDLNFPAEHLLKEGESAGTQ